MVPCPRSAPCPRWALLPAGALGTRSASASLRDRHLRELFEDRRRDLFRVRDQVALGRHGGSPEGQDEGDDGDDRAAVRGDAMLKFMRAGFGSEPRPAPAVRRNGLNAEFCKAPCRRRSVPGGRKPEPCVISCSTRR